MLFFLQLSSPKPERGGSCWNNKIVEPGYFAGVFCLTMCFLDNIMKHLTFVRQNLVYFRLIVKRNIWISGKLIIFHKIKWLKNFILKRFRKN